MINEQSILSQIQKFKQSQFDVSEVSKFESLKTEHLEFLAKKLQYIGAVSSNALDSTLIGYDGWSSKIKTVRSEFGHTGSSSQQQLSNRDLHHINTQTGEGIRSQTTEVEYYCYARHLQLFFNNEENWAEWESQLKSKSTERRALKKLKECWFAQNQFAITPARILIQVQKERDEINEYLQALRLEFKEKKPKPPLSQKIEEMISALTTYVKNLTSQLKATAELRLNAGLSAKMPDRDQVVNEILHELTTLGITTGKLSQVTESTQVFNQLKSTRVKNSNKKSIQLKENTPYRLSNFAPRELYHLDNEQYLALQVLSQSGDITQKKQEKSVSASNQSPSIYNPIAAEYGVSLEQTKSGITLYLPANISIKSKPIKNLQTDYVQDQQLTLASCYWLERQDLSIQMLNFANFNKSVEKVRFDQVYRLYQSIITALKNLENNDNESANQWRLFYQARLLWINDLLNKWLQWILRPAVEPLVLTEKDVNGAIKYYTFVNELLESSLIKDSLNAKHKRALQERLDTLKRRSNQYIDDRAIAHYQQSSPIVEKISAATTIRYYPRNISAPANRPRFDKLFATETLQFDLNQQQQPLLKKLFEIGKKIAVGQDLSMDDFKAQDEIKQKFIELSCEERKHQGIFAWRKRAVCNQWQTFYQKQFPWLENQFKNCGNQNDYAKSKSDASITVEPNSITLENVQNNQAIRKEWAIQNQLFDEHKKIEFELAGIGVFQANSKKILMALRLELQQKFTARFENLLAIGEQLQEQWRKKTQPKNNSHATSVENRLCGVSESELQALTIFFTQLKNSAVMAVSMLNQTHVMKAQNLQQTFTQEKLQFEQANQFIRQKQAVSNALAKLEKGELLDSLQFNALAEYIKTLQNPVYNVLPEKFKEQCLPAVLRLIADLRLAFRDIYREARENKIGSPSTSQKESLSHRLSMLKLLNHPQGLTQMQSILEAQLTRYDELLSCNTAANYLQTLETMLVNFGDQSLKEKTLHARTLRIQGTSHEFLESAAKRTDKHFFASNQRRLEKNLQFADKMVRQYLLQTKFNQNLLAPSTVELIFSLRDDMVLKNQLDIKSEALNGLARESMLSLAKIKGLETLPQWLTRSAAVYLALKEPPATNTQWQQYNTKLREDTANMLGLQTQALSFKPIRSVAKEPVSEHTGGIQTYKVLSF